MTYMNYAANRDDSMKTKGDSRRVHGLIPALLRSHSKQMTYMNYTANSYYSMKPKEIGAATVSEFVTLGIFNASMRHITRLASKIIHSYRKEEPAVRKSRRGDTAATSFYHNEEPAVRSTLTAATRYFCHEEPAVRKGHPPLRSTSFQPWRHRGDPPTYRHLTVCRQTVEVPHVFKLPRYGVRAASFMAG